MGNTERIALEAGTVWWDGDLFSGSPDWQKLLDFKVQALSEEERQFLDGPVHELCQMLDEWKIEEDRGHLDGAAVAIGVGITSAKTPSGTNTAA